MSRIILPPCEKCGTEKIMDCPDCGADICCPKCCAELFEKIKVVVSCRKCKHAGEHTCIGTGHTRDNTIGEILDRRDPNRYECGLLKVRVPDPLKPACHGESYIFQDSKYLRREYRKSDWWLRNMER